VPCGAAAKEVFEAAKITAKPDSLGQDVRAALTKVSLSEVDAALVYKTDVQAAAGKVDGIECPEADKAINEYPIATLTKARTRPVRRPSSICPVRQRPHLPDQAGFDAP
jgi:molybdate transport system substrate-binding protein